MSNDALDGMKEICKYLGKSENTVLKMKKLEGLPIKKIVGVWMGSKLSIDRWRQRIVEEAS